MSRKNVAFTPAPTGRAGAHLTSRRRAGRCTEAKADRRNAIDGILADSLLPLRCGRAAVRNQLVLVSGWLGPCTHPHPRHVEGRDWGAHKAWMLCAACRCARQHCSHGLRLHAMDVPVSRTGTEACLSSPQLPPLTCQPPAHRLRLSSIGLWSSRLAFANRECALT